MPSLQFCSFFFSPWKCENKPVSKVGYFHKIAEIFRPHLVYVTLGEPWVFKSAQHYDKKLSQLYCSPKQPRTSFPFYKFFYTTISNRISGSVDWILALFMMNVFHHPKTSCKTQNPKILCTNSSQYGFAISGPCKPIYHWALYVKELLTSLS